MGDYIYARFVGGPWHNRHIAVRDCPHVYCPIIPPVTLSAITEIVTADVFRTETYFRCRAVSAMGAHFTEFVHESLMNGARPQPSMLNEATFPPMPTRLEVAFMDRMFDVYARQRRLLKAPV